MGAATSVGGGLGPLLQKPMDVQPLPLGAQVPVTISVPRHQASNGDGFVLVIEASYECLFEVISYFSHS